MSLYYRKNCYCILISKVVLRNQSKSLLSLVTSLANVHISGCCRNSHCDLPPLLNHILLFSHARIISCWATKFPKIILKASVMRRKDFILFNELSISGRQLFMSCLNKKHSSVKRIEKCKTTGVFILLFSLELNDFQFIRTIWRQVNVFFSFISILLTRQPTEIDKT